MPISKLEEFRRDPTTQEKSRETVLQETLRGLLRNKDAMVIDAIDALAEEQWEQVLEIHGKTDAEDHHDSILCAINQLEDDIEHDYEVIREELKSKVALKVLEDLRGRSSEHLGKALVWALASEYVLYKGRKGARELSLARQELMIARELWAAMGYLTDAEDLAAES